MRRAETYHGRRKRFARVPREAVGRRPHWTPIVFCFFHLNGLFNHITGVRTYVRGMHAMPGLIVVARRALTAGTREWGGTPRGRGPRTPARVRTPIIKSTPGRRVVCHILYTFIITGLSCVRLRSHFIRARVLCRAPVYAHARTHAREYLGTGIGSPSYAYTQNTNTRTRGYDRNGRPPAILLRFDTREDPSRTNAGETSAETAVLSVGAERRNRR